MIADCKNGDPSEARHVYLIFRKVLRVAGGFFCLFFGLAIPMSAQDLDGASSNGLRDPGWNYGAQLSGGATILQISSPRFVTANRSISNVTVALHAGRVLTGEHGSGWVRGTFEWDFSIIPVEYFWVLGSHYTGGFEAFCPHWNFTGRHHRVVPFVGVSWRLAFQSQQLSFRSTTQRLRPFGNAERAQPFNGAEPERFLFPACENERIDPTKPMKELANCLATLDEGGGDTWTPVPRSAPPCNY